MTEGKDWVDEMIDRRIHGVEDPVREMKGFIRKMSAELAEVEQILGKALGYPWYRDDQKNFPGATTEDGVCVGEHTTASLAGEAVGLIEDLRWSVRDLTEDL